MNRKFIFFDFNESSGVTLNNISEKEIILNSYNPDISWQEINLYSDDGFDDPVVFKGILAKNYDDDSYQIFFNDEDIIPYSQSKFKDQYTIEEITGKPESKI